MLSAFQKTNKMMSTEERLRLVELELAAVRAEYQAYASAISHDLSAPLRAIGGFSEIIQGNNEDVFDDKTKRHFDFIIKGAQDAKAMLDNLREFANLHNVNTEFDGQTLVNHVWDSLSEFLPSTGAEFKVDTIPYLMGDKEQIRLLFYHLLKNAAMYRSTSETPRINVSCNVLEKHIEFIVSDNGIGVPEKMDDRIFQVLKRAVSPKEYSGHGMGLAIARKVVQHHGGTIDLLRNSTEKTAFRFTLAKKPIVI